jgi:1-acyl-sn-glycerol-3-phosphate acyltransferase
MILLCTGIRYRLEGEDIKTMKGVYVYTANHTSPIDILVIMAAFPGYFAFMAKAEMEKIPLFGMFFRTIDIAVDRSSRMKSATSYKKSIEALNSGKGLVIFPEGGILGTIPILQEFKDGAFDLAIRQKIAVLPFTFPDNWKLMPDDERKIGKPGKIRIILHKPIETAGLTKEDVPAVRDKVFKIIEADMKKYS